MTLASLKQALSDRQQRRWTVTWRFEGLRLLKPALRLATALETAGHDVVLGWPDAGSTALAQRESPELAAHCFALKDLMLSSDPEITGHAVGHWTATQRLRDGRADLQQLARSGGSPQWKA